MASFVLNDEKAINSYGFMILNSGGRLDRFKSNPVLLNGHNHDLVSGKWENLRIEGDQLIADPLFDTEDPESMKLKGKVDRGFLPAIVAVLMGLLSPISCNPNCRGRRAILRLRFWFCR